MSEVAPVVPGPDDEVIDAGFLSLPPDIQQELTTYGAERYWLGRLRGALCQQAQKLRQLEEQNG